MILMKVLFLRICQQNITRVFPIIFTFKMDVPFIITCMAKEEFKYKKCSYEEWA